MQNPYENPENQEAHCAGCGKKEWVLFYSEIYFCMKCVRKWMNNPSFRYDFRS